MEQNLTEAQREQLPPEEVEAFENQKAQNLQVIEDELQAQMEADSNNEKRIAELVVQAKRSIDEERDKKKFTDKIYKKDFIPDKESVNCVPAIMSAMVSQIAIENEAVAASEAEVSTEPETIDDLFESFKEDIAIKT